MDWAKSSKEKNENENGSKIRWFRKRRNKDKENLEKFESTGKPNIFNAIKKNLQKKFYSSKRQNKVKSVENLNPVDKNETSEDEDFTRLFIKQAHNSIKFSSITSRDSTASNLVMENPPQEPAPIPPIPSTTTTTTQADVTSRPPIEEPVIEVRQPPVDPPPPAAPQATEETNIDALIESVQEDLLRHTWYWPNLDRMAAQKILSGRPNGSFLVRDSGTAKNQFTLSFRSSGVTLHCRINYKNNAWSYIENVKSTSIEALIESNIEQSKTSVVGYVKNNSNLYPPFPVRICYPIHRSIPSLQELCMAIIKSKVTKNDVNEVTKLPLPNQIKEFVKDNFNTL